MSSPALLRAIAAVALTVANLLQAPATVQAVQISVTTAEDELVTNGRCSLREAIRNANADAPTHPDCSAGYGHDTIVLPAGTFRLAIPGRNEEDGRAGDLDIRGDLTLIGAGAAATILDGAGLDRVLDAIPEVVLEVARLTVQHGDTGQVVEYDSGNGGGIRHAYGNRRGRGRLTLTDMVARENVSHDGGGGVTSWQPTEIKRSQFIGNRALGTGGGGGVEVVDRLVATDSTFSFNTVGYGWGGEGIGNGRGGGVSADDALIAGSTINGNKAGDEGGALDVLTLDLNNSTLVDNTSGDSGGALRILYSATIRNSTIVRNTSNAAGGVNAYREALSQTRIRNSIVAFNVDRFEVGTENCRPGVVSDGFNIEDKRSCGFTNTGDRQFADPLLGPLADNGGPTQTMRLLPGSPALDAGDFAACPSNDQRGTARPFDGDGNGNARCDIGAFEAGDVMPPAPVVSCSPRPPVRIMTTNSGTFFARVTISATTNPDSLMNTLRSLTFGQIRNAIVRLGFLEQIRSGQRLGVPPNQVSIELSVSRESGTQGEIVPISVEDACGSWQTFIGLGTGRNQPIASPTTR